MTNKPTEEPGIECNVSIFGSTLIIRCNWRRIRQPAIPWLFVTPFLFPYWMFHGLDLLLSTKTIGNFRDWHVRSRRWEQARARTRWHEERPVWKSLLANLDRQDILADVEVCSDGAKLEWPSRRVVRKGFLTYESDPPSEMLKRDFEEFLRRLHHIWRA